MPLLLKRQCDRTLGEQHGGLRRRVDAEPHLLPPRHLRQPDEGERDATPAQTLGQLQPFLAVQLYSHRDARASFHLLGQPNTFPSLQLGYMELSHLAPTRKLINLTLDGTPVGTASLKTDDSDGKGSGPSPPMPPPPPAGAPPLRPALNFSIVVTADDTIKSCSGRNRYGAQGFT